MLVSQTPYTTNNNIVKPSKRKTQEINLAELFLEESTEEKRSRRPSKARRDLISLLSIYGMSVTGTGVLGSYKTLETTETQTATMPIVLEIAASETNSLIHDLLHEEYIRETVREIFSIGEYEILADSQEREFSDRLLDFIDHFHNEAVAAIEEAIGEAIDNVNLIADVLSAVGNSDDVASHEMRCGLLVKYLTSSTPLIRYGAIMGLISLNDFKSIPAVKDALKTETDKMLRGILGQLLDRLTK